MTRAEFAAAAAENRQVRLLDRSRTFYVDEWYDPIADNDGTLRLDTHTGETIKVGDELLAQLTTESPLLTVGELRKQLDRYADDAPVVLQSGDHYGGITAESISQVLLQPRATAEPRETRYAMATYNNLHAPDVFNAVQIGHAAR